MQPGVAASHNAPSVNSEPRNILVLDFGQLGDVVLSLPALAAIRKRFPQARITVAGGSAAALVLEMSGSADRTVAIDRVSLRDGPKLRSLALLARLVADMRRARYDLAIDLHSLSESNLLAYLSGARERVFAQRGGRSLGLLATLRTPWEDLDKHQVDRYLDVLGPLGVRLPLAVKRGYHRHFRPRGNSGLTLPVVDAELGYCVAPMEQGLRLTTGAEFAARDAPPTPVQCDRLLPAARKMFPLGEPVDAAPWLGSRPCFADSRPVIGRAPRKPGLWLAYGHAHWGLTLGPATGRLLAQMMTGATPFCDPTPYDAERFIR